MRLTMLALVFVALAACSQQTQNPPPAGHQNNNAISNKLDNGER